jgi:hypothetical protein
VEGFKRGMWMDVDVCGGVDVCLCVCGGVCVSV